MLIIMRGPECGCMDPEASPKKPVGSSGKPRHTGGGQSRCPVHDLGVDVRRLLLVAGSCSC